MNSRERSVVDAVYSLNGDPREPEPRERFNPMLAIKVGITARRYRRQLDLIAEQRASSIVQQRLDGGDFAQPVDALVAGLLHDFPLETQTVVKQRSQAIESHIQEVSQTVARELADQTAIRNFQVQHLRDELHDKRQILEQARGDPLPLMEEPESLKRHFGTEKALAVAYEAFGRLRATLVLAAALVLAAFSLETILTYFSLAPVLAGTARVSEWMIAAQAIVLSSVLLFLGHLLWSKNTGLRWLAAAGLTAIAVGLAVVRAGVVTHGAGGAETQDPMALTLIGLMALSGLGLAVIGGQGFRRAQKASAKISGLRIRVGGKTAAMEAELAEWKATRAHHRNREEELSRLVPRLEQDISRLESRLQSETAETRELVQRSIREAVNRRLSPEIRNMAQQLAHWKYDPDSARRNGSMVRGLLTAAVTLSLTVFAGSACSPRAPAVHHLLIDTSGSISSDIAERMRARVFQEAQSWIKTANPGDEFAVWWLTEDGSAYPANHKALEMPALQIPAYASREAFAGKVVSKLENWLDELPHGVKRTRLLESIYYIGSTSTEDLTWSITILSDLREDSRSWDSIQAADSKDSGLVKSMLELCPPVRVPPVTVSLVSWPGLINGSGGIKEHQDARRLFTQFFERWAPDSTIHVMSL